MNLYPSFFVVILALSGCSTTTINNVSPDYKLTEIEKIAYGTGIIQSQSKSLPNFVYDATIEIKQEVNTTTKQVISSIKKHGKLKQKYMTSEPIKVIGTVGSGYANMNPAGLIIKVYKISNGTRLSIRAIAKEGLIKQNTGGKAVERLISDIKNKSKLTITRI